MSTSAGGDYRMRVCIIDDCGADLYIVNTFSTPIYNTSRADELADPGIAVSSSWQVECTEGHVVVLPEAHGDDGHPFGTCDGCAEETDRVDPHQDLSRVHTMSRVGEQP